MISYDITYTSIIAKNIHTILEKKNTMETRIIKMKEYVGMSKPKKHTELCC